MKNFLTLLALGLAAATPAAFILELAGASLPAFVDSSHLFGAGLVAFLALILFADYAEIAAPPVAVAPLLTLPANPGEKDSLRLAA